MLASGGMQRCVMLLLANMPLVGDDEPLSHFLEQGLSDGAQLTIVVSESVDVDARAALTNPELASFAGQGAELEHLNLKWCGQVDDVGLLSLSMNCPNLQRVNLSFCQLVSDEGLQALGRCSRKLLNIILVGCWRVTDEGLRALSEGCPLLEDFAWRLWWEWRWG